MLFYGYKQCDSKIYMNRQMTQNSHCNSEIQEQSWRTDTTRL